MAATQNQYSWNTGNNQKYVWNPKTGAVTTEATTPYITPLENQQLINTFNSSTPAQKAKARADLNAYVAANSPGPGKGFQPGTPEYNEVQRLSTLANGPPKKSSLFGTLLPIAAVVASVALGPEIMGALSAAGSEVAGGESVTSLLGGAGSDELLGGAAETLGGSAIGADGLPVAGSFAAATGVPFAGDVGIPGAIKTAGSIVSTISNITSGVSTIVGAASGAAATYEAGQNVQFQAKQSAINYMTQAQNYDFLQTQAVKNSNIAMANKVYEQQKEAADEEIMQRETGKQIGTATTGYAASGVVANSGSAADVKQDMANEGALKVAMSSFESKERQRQFDIQYQNAVDQASQYGKSAAGARSNAATILTNSDKAGAVSNTVAGIQAITAIPQIINGGKTIINAL